MDKIYLRENKNTTALSKHFHETFQDLTDEGFLDLATWSGQSPQAQQLWYNRCAKADLAGAQSWILFSDLDEYPVITEGYVTSLGYILLRGKEIVMNCNRFFFVRAMF